MIEIRPVVAEGQDGETAKGCVDTFWGESYVHDLNLVTVSQAYTYVKTDQIAPFKGVQWIVNSTSKGNFFF